MPPVALQKIQNFASSIETLVVPFAGDVYPGYINIGPLPYEGIGQGA